MSVKERLARVEEQLKFVREDVSSLKESFSSLNTKLDELKASINPHLSSRDKATILVALITAIGAIIVASLK